MTAGTIISDTEVIEISRTPSHCCVAVITGVTARDMGWMFTGGDVAVMACVTRTHHLCVVHRKGGYPGVWRMTVFANLAGLNVRQVLACGISAVVATGTIASDVHVIEVRGEPADG